VRAAGKADRPASPIQYRLVRVSRLPRPSADLVDGRPELLPLIGRGLQCAASLRCVAIPEVFVHEKVAFEMDSGSTMAAS